MDVTRYAREQWGRGTRSEDEVAAAFIRLAMASPDPVEMLLSAVRAAVYDAFHAERAKTEARAWDLLSQVDAGTSTGTTPQPATGTSDITAWPRTGAGTSDVAAWPSSATGTKTTTAGRTYLGVSHPASTLDTINALLRTHVWVWRVKENGHSDGCMIPWAELTLTDIEPTIARERDVIAGHERRISRLVRAKALMEKHGVTVFGKIPFGTEVADLIEA